MKSLQKEILSLYSESPGIDLFTKIRFWTGSFAEIEPFVPRSGTILDLGCGYGIFTNYLGLSGPRRRVLGVDLDKNKLNHAHKGIKNVLFRYGDATRMNVPHLKGIILLDVLHHLASHRAQEDLIKMSASMLASKGRLIISEVDNRPLWKLPLARLADFLLYPSQPVYYRYSMKLFPLLQKYFDRGNITTFLLHSNPFPHRLYVCQKK